MLSSWDKIEFFFILKVTEVQECRSRTYLFILNGNMLQVDQQQSNEHRLWCQHSSRLTLAELQSTVWWMQVETTSRNILWLHQYLHRPPASTSWQLRSGLGSDVQVPDWPGELPLLNSDPFVFAALSWRCFWTHHSFRSASSDLQCFYYCSSDWKHFFSFLFYFFKPQCYFSSPLRLQK